MNLSFGAWAFTRGPFQARPLSLHRILHKLEDEGYSGIELAAYPPHPTVDSPTSHREGVRQEIADHGLTVTGLAPDLRGCKLMSVADPAPFIERIQSHLEFAANLGAPAVRVATVEPLAEMPALDTNVMIERAVNAFGECARRAADLGLRIAWEFEPHLPLHSPAEIVAVVEAVRSRGHANFGILFDVAHAHICTGGDPLSLIAPLHGRINHLHLCDADGSVDEHGVSRHLAFGRGRIDFATLLPALAAAAEPSASYTVDLYNCPEAWDAVAPARQFLSSFFAKGAE